VGIVLAVCSCTIVPLFAGNYKKGAGLGPPITFLFFAPAANILALVYTGGVIALTWLSLACSFIRDRDPKDKIEIGWTPYLYKQKTLQEVVLDYAQKEASFEIGSFELLLTWGIHEAKVFLVEDAIKDSPNEYYHRPRILRWALDGREGYLGWV
jgi:hypothetical protein